MTPAGERARAREKARSAAAAARTVVENTLPLGAPDLRLVEAVRQLAHAVDLLADVSEAQETGAGLPEDQTRRVPR